VLKLSSMTGFARAEGAVGAWSWAVEARSVNGRNLEVRFRGPPGFDGLERLAREAAQARFARGQINVSMQARRAESSGAVKINQEQLDRYLAVSAALTAQGHIAPPSADGLLALRGVLETGEAEEDAEARAAVEAAMGASLAQAFDGLKTSRQAEGASLAVVLAGLVDQIEALTRDAEGQAAAQAPAIRDRFAKRLAELLGEAAPQDRILRGGGDGGEGGCARGARPARRPCRRGADADDRGRRGRTPPRLPHPGIHARGQHAVQQIGRRRLDRDGPGAESRHRSVP